MRRRTMAREMLREWSKSVSVDDANARWSIDGRPASRRRLWLAWGDDVGFVNSRKNEGRRAGRLRDVKSRRRLSTFVHDCLLYVENIEGIVERVDRVVVGQIARTERP